MKIVKIIIYCLLLALLMSHPISATFLFFVGLVLTVKFVLLVHKNKACQDENPTE